MIRRLNKRYSYIGLCNFLCKKMFNKIFLSSRIKPCMANDLTIHEKNSFEPNSVRLFSCCLCL